MVIVEKRRKVRRCGYVIFLARRGSEEETGSTQHSIGEGEVSERYRSKGRVKLI
jgi:hypothetical protein